MKKNTVVVFAFLVIFVGGFLYFRFINDWGIPEVIRNEPVETERAEDSIDNQTDGITSGAQFIAEDLEIPWEVAFLPDGDILVTERSGSLLKIGDNKTVIEVEGVKHTGEGGLLGMVLHPDFEDNSYIYLYLTTEAGGQTINRVERYVFNGDSLSDKTVILDNIPGASYHDGGRMEFGPDGYLYVTTGDAGNEDSAQDTTSLAGSILRLNDDGTIPEDNPFGNEIYSYGHRNPQGLAWDDQGRLWATEHGRSGALSGFDELNLIEMGKNYGWPVIQGDETMDGMVTPAAHSGATTTWAPAGLEFVDGKLYFAGLRGSTLYTANINEDGSVKIGQDSRIRYGRLRAVRLGPDGYLYVTTSNTDGRGNPRDGDDKLIKVNLSISPQRQQ